MNDRKNLLSIIPAIVIPLDVTFFFPYTVGKRLTADRKGKFEENKNNYE